MTGTRTRYRATTIIEVVMALTILAIALPTLVKAFGDTSSQSIQPVHTTVASFLAIERMEEIIARRYRGTDGYDAVTTANFPAESPVSGFSMFNRTVTITTVDSSLATSGSDVGYKKVRVAVLWNNKSRMVYVERIFANFN